MRFHDLAAVVKIGLEAAVMRWVVAGGDDHAGIATELAHRERKLRSGARPLENIRVATEVSADLRTEVGEVLGEMAGIMREGEEQTRKLRLEFSRFFVFGGEESYGYLGSDAVRDKDANGATLMFAEVAAYAKSVGKTLPELLDVLFAEFGYYLEIGKSLTMEGADGAAKIQALAGSYASSPPGVIDGSEVTRFRDSTVGKRPS